MVSRRGSRGVPEPSTAGAMARMISSSRPASANSPTRSPPPANQTLRPWAATIIASCTRWTSPLTMKTLASGTGGSSRWVKTQHGTSPYMSCQFSGSSSTLSFFSTHSYVAAPIAKAPTPEKNAPNGLSVPSSTSNSQSSELSRSAV